MIYYDRDNILVRSSVEDDVAPLAMRLRRGDVAEVMASHGHSPLEAVGESFKASNPCMTVEVKGDIAVMFGVVGGGLLTQSGVIWMLATDNMDKIGFRFYRHTRDFVKMFLNEYVYLYNYVHEENRKSIAWLRRSGANIREPEPYGMNGELFRYFSFERG